MKLDHKSQTKSIVKLPGNMGEKCNCGEVGGINEFSVRRINQLWRVGLLEGALLFFNGWQYQCDSGFTSDGSVFCVVGGYTAGVNGEVVHIITRLKYISIKLII